MNIGTLKKFINILPEGVEMDNVKILSRSEHKGEMFSALDVDYIRDPKSDKKYLVIWTD